MYVSSDPRSQLAPAAATKAPTPVAYAPASYCRFYESKPAHDDANGRVWMARGANFVIAHTQAKPGGSFTREHQVDEWAIINPDRDTPLVVETPAGRTEVPPYSIVFVPPGRSTVSAPKGGRFVRLFSAQSKDLNAQCENASLYEAAPPNIPPFQSWPEPRGGYKVRVYSLDVPEDPSRFGRIYRCTTLMINYLDPRVGPRDTSKLSPHHHDDFEQGSLVLDGDFIHDIRWPWTPDMAIWREDEHARCGAPSLTVIPPPTIHTSRAVDAGLNQMVDIFAPPRLDFSQKRGWILNADDYPMPGEASGGDRS